MEKTLTAIRTEIWRALFGGNGVYLIPGPSRKLTMSGAFRINDVKSLKGKLSMNYRQLKLGGFLAH